MDTSNTAVHHPGKVIRAEAWPLTERVTCFLFLFFPSFLKMPVRKLCFPLCMVINNTSNAHSLKLLGQLLPVNTLKACFLWWGRNKKSWAANRCFNGISENCEGRPHGYCRCQSEIAAHQRNQSEKNMSHSSGAATGGQYVPRCWPALLCSVQPCWRSRRSLWFDWQELKEHGCKSPSGPWGPAIFLFTWNGPSADLHIACAH